MLKITDIDIKRAEALFFDGKGSFEDERGERYSCILCIDKSIDVEACPGSGKTTCLLAKIYLLSEKMPIENGRGICVLTHTNVAINEIKNKLGTKPDRLFQYPNFFGTFQSFVDKYLAIPYYAIKNAKRPYKIDSDKAFKTLLSTFSTGVTRADLNKIRTYLYANEGLTKKLTIRRIDDDRYDLVKGVDGEKIEIKKPNSNVDWSSAEKSQLYNALFKLKSSVLKNSAILSFDDAYFYANEYISKYPQIKLAISRRFSHLFIDEMQDTYVHQNTLLKKLFDDDVIIQRIGDSNQAILNDNYSESAWEPSTRLKITGSRRFSQPIANILKTVALKGDKDLTGLKNIAIPPHIITYESGRETQVLEEYVTLIHKFGLDNVTEFKYPLKAVGWVGKEKEGLTISSYFESYSKTLLKKRALDSLKSAVLNCNALIPKEFRNTVIDCCLEVLRLAGIKNDINKKYRYFNRTSFLKHLQYVNPEFYISFNAKLSDVGRRFLIGPAETIIAEMRKYLKEDFFPQYGFTLNVDAQEFIDQDEVGEVSEEQIESKNIFRSSQEHLKHIPVEIATVHSVKGETHSATLYLETFYYKTCGQYLIEQLIGNFYDGRGGKRKDMCLKIAHVGMSRPTHLLCVALNKEIVDKYQNELQGNGWIIV